MTRERLLEQDYAAALVKHLQRRGGIVYQEVAFRYGARADIVVDYKGVRASGGLEVIETKATMSLDLLHQALRWRTLASQVSVATPLGWDCRHWDVVEHVFSHFGFGLYAIATYDKHEFTIREQIMPERRSADEARLRRILRSEQIDYAPAGNAAGRYITRWRITRCALIDLVTRNGTMPLSRAVREIEHHYGTNAIARCALRTQIMRGDIPELAIVCKHGTTFVALAQKEVSCDQQDTDRVFG